MHRFVHLSKLDSSFSCIRKLHTLHHSLRVRRSSEQVCLTRQSITLLTHLLLASSIPRLPRFLSSWLAIRGAFRSRIHHASIRARHSLAVASATSLVLVISLVHLGQHRALALRIIDHDGPFVILALLIQTSTATNEGLERPACSHDCGVERTFSGAQRKDL
jgi:hypothetical protein